jgi:4-amino-4-deoxy-L-arabinose transferase-like glycosyltransferase
MTERSFRRGLGLIAFLGFLARLAFLLAVPAQPIDDFWSYFARARNLVVYGEYGPFPHRPDASYPPAYPLTLALAHLLPGDALLHAKLIDALLGTAAVVLAGLLARRWWGPAAGLVAAGLAAGYPRYVAMSSVLASENLFQPLLLLALLLLATAWERPRAFRLAATAGAVLGLLTLTRSVGLLFGFVWPLGSWLAGKRTRVVAAETLLLLAAQGVVLLPWALRNQATLGRFTPLTSVGGVDLFIGNSDGATGDWYDWRPELAKIEPRLPELSVFSVDDAARAAAKDWIRHHRRRAAALYLLKLRRIVIQDEGYIVHYAISGQGFAPPESQRPVLPADHPLKARAEGVRRLFAAAYWTLLALGLAGCAALLARAGRHRERRPAAQALTLLAGAAYFPLTAAVFLGSPRFGWPPFDLLLPAAAFLLAGLFKGRTAHYSEREKQDPKPRLTERSTMIQARLALLAGLMLAASAGAQTVGSSNPATADPTVPQPGTTPCAVQLYSNYEFADFSPKPFTYTPPAACPGPWAKVVLEADFSVTAGRQFDRTAQIAIGHVNVYYGTTAEPSASVSPSWHVERDLTDYSPLFASAQTGEVNLGNLVNSTYTGILHGSARVLLYPPSAAAPAPRAADAVLPLSTAPGGAALLQTGSDVLAASFSLPANVEAAYLDVIPQSQSNDEFWYTCVPDDAANVVFSCGGTAFREAEVTVDGQPAGVAPVYPWIYTGGIDPLLWRPIPGVQTLNFLPYRVDLTPFAGVLSNGQPHQVGVSVYNANHYFLVAASLLIYQDHGSAQVTGAVTQNTIGAVPPPSIQESLTTAADGTVTGTIATRDQRAFTVSGYVNTSHGRVETTVRQALLFSNQQQFDVEATVYVQNIQQDTEIVSSVDTKGPHSVAHSEKHISYPLSLDYSFLANADGSGSQTTSIDQEYNSQEALGGNAVDSGLSQVSNAVKSADTLLFNASGAITGYQDRNSSQTYIARGSGGACYSKSVTAASGVVTGVVVGQGCGNRDH